MAFAAAAPIIGSIAGSLVSGAFSKRGSHSANQASAAMAREQMAFQERMSNTAHQREVQDLLAAGLNPILSGTGGAGSSTPAGASHTFSNEMEGAAGAVGQMTSSAMSAKLAQQEWKNSLATFELLRNQGHKLFHEGREAASRADMASLESSFFEKFGLSNAQAASRQNAANASMLESMVPEARAREQLWKDLGEGGEVAKGLGAAAPVVRMLMSIFGGGKR